MRKKIIYISGKISNGERENSKAINKNTNIARDAAIKLWNMGFAVICPHLNTIDFHNDERVTVDFMGFIEGDYSIMDASHAIYFLKNWRESEGAILEETWAKQMNMVRFYEDNLVQEDLINFRDNGIYLDTPIIKMYKNDLQKSFICIPRL